MSLTEYRRKREFSKTREPEPGKPLPKGKRAIFVVQLHHASRRHYDFRLQVGDALKSWAVPKGPSFDPSVKRLAAEVEDHPVDYAGFEGEIPAGEYGGGHVALFDRGVWATSGNPEEQLAKGHLRFELFGDKLKGGWHLVRSGKPARQPQWLLFKDKDRYAGEREADDMLADVTPDPRKADAGKSTKKSTVATKATAAANKATKAPAQPAKATKATKKATKKAPAKAAAAPKARAPGKRVDWAAEAAALPGARRRRLADAPFEPQLARLGDAPPPGDAWLHEAKWDGYRLVSVVRGGTPRIWSRNALEWTQKVPEIAAALEQLGVEEVALDGELIAGGGTQADFGLLQATLSGEASGQLSYVLFDILHLDGVDIGGVPQLARKELLERLLAGAAPPLRYSSHVAGHGDEAYAHADEAGLEGIISKRATAPYRGGRGDDWRKTKHLLSDEFAVVGFTAPKGSRSGFGSLLLARPAGDGGWRYAGRVGSGFSDELLRSLSKALDRDTSTRPTVDVPEMDAALRSAKWLQPAAVVEVFYRGIGNGGLLRQPSLKGLRPDKAPADLADSDRSTSDKASKPGGTRTARGKAATPATAKAAGTSTRVSRSTTAKTAPATKTAARANRGRGAIGAPPADEVQLSSPTRVVYPDVGVTKRGVFDYYAGIMDWLLPEIIDRPVSIVRCTQGVGRPCFFQKHHTPGLEGVGMARLKEESGTQAEYLVVRDARSILELVQFNAVEFHPWGAHAGSPDRADRIVFDLDPGPGVSWAEVVDAARKVRGLLEQLELESFLRTTGGKGLHVVVPLNPGCDWSLVKPFAQGFATTMAQVEPLKFVATATKKFRTGKIFIDYLRNGRGATSVASFSLRSREGAPIAMPLRWEELGKVKSGAAFDIVSGPKRMQRLKAHPWDGIDAVRQDLDKVGRLLAQHAPAKTRRSPL